MGPGPWAQGPGPGPRAWNARVRPSIYIIASMGPHRHMGPWARSQWCGPGPGLGPVAGGVTLFFVTKYVFMVLDVFYFLVEIREFGSHLREKPFANSDFLVRISVLDRNHGVRVPSKGDTIFKI